MTSMAEARKESRRKTSIKSSICQIRTEVPGNELGTTGSACVLKWLWKIDELHGQRTTPTATTAKSETTFVVTTSQVVTKSDLFSNKSWKADFLPVKRFGTETFSLNNVPVYEVPCQSNEIKIILIPAEPLHRQKKFSQIRGNELQTARFQLCQPKGSESEIQAAKAKQLLYCYVLSESASSNDKFALQCYLLCVEESGSYFLQAHGSKAKLRTAEDFQPTEKPKGSVILNELGYVVGFLAFSDKDEILPLFFPQAMPDNNQATHVEINPETTETADGLLEGCSGSDSVESQSSHGSGNDSDQDANGNQTEENRFPSCIIKESKQDNLEGSGDFGMHSKALPGSAKSNLQSTFEDPCQGLEMEENQQMVGNHNQPSELSYVSQTMEGNSDDGVPEETETRRSGDGEEERNVSRPNQSHAQRSLPQDMEPDPHSTMHDDPNSDGMKMDEVTVSASGGYASSSSQDPQAYAPPFNRSYSEQLTPRTQRKLQKSYSVTPLIPLRSGALVGNAVMHKAYVIDALSRQLDPTCRGRQNWKHLANLNDVPTELVLKCQSQERHSRSEAMFKVLAASNPDLPIGTLKCHLQDLQLNKERDYIANLDDQMTIEDFLESEDPSITGKVCIALDLQPDEKWQKLGIKLGVEHQDLSAIKIDCANQHQNPAGDVIELICAKKPTMTISQFKEHLKNIKRTDVKNKLGDLKETWTICDFHDDLDLMRVVTSMLNGADNSRVKNYKDLADECGISSDLYQSLQPPCAGSPTKEVIEEIVGRKPNYTVEELFTNLHDMERLDAIEAIRCYFIEEDVRALKRKLQISDE